ncbi:MAG: hypothetical protein IPJ13_25035 [Saprospiraceae bacterium]|nr:hypothetical protein [Saprospiraceae bacterium]
MVYQISSKYVWIADPKDNKIKLTHDEFKKSYCSDGELGVTLLLETTPEFFQKEWDDQHQKGFSFLIEYLKPHKKLVFQVLIGLL